MTEEMASMPRGGGAGDFVTPGEPVLTGTQLRDADTSPRFRIGEIAERTGLSMRSIRYYEETGLVTPAGRTDGGFRMYSEVDVQRLLGIMQMKPLGFSLERTRDVLADLDILRDTSGTDSTRSEARSRLADLHSEMRAALEALARRVEIARSFTERLDDELADFDARH